MTIQIIHRNEINEAKWNSLITQYQESSPYVTLHYLDAVCIKWSALIFDDYQGILPFCWNKKWGVNYIYQPPFLQQMIYVGETLNSILLEKVIQILYAQFAFLDYKINIPLSTISRKNYIIDLNQSYELIQNNYSSQTQKNLKNKSLEIVEGTDIKDFLLFYRNNTIPKIENWKSEFSQIQQTLLNTLHQKNELLLLGVRFENEIISMTALVHTTGRLVHLMPSSNETGRAKHGTSFIIDHLLKKYAHQPIIFDFEGSEIEGIEKFIKGFGAINHPYFHLMSNRLRFPFTIFKK